MLDQARTRAAAAHVELDLRQGGIRDLELDEQAALIYCPFRALFHLPTWADRRRTLERVAASLWPGGRFAWNVFAFDHQAAARVEGQHQDKPVPHTVRFAVADNRIDITLDDGATSSLWWATKNEWLGLLDVSGFELDALFGGFIASHSMTTATSTSSSPAGDWQPRRLVRPARLQLTAPRWGLPQQLLHDAVEVRGGDTDALLVQLLPKSSKCSGVGRRQDLARSFASHPTLQSHAGFQLRLRDELHP